MDTYRELLAMGLKGLDNQPCECIKIDEDRFTIKVEMLSCDKDIFNELEKHLSPSYRTVIS